MTCDGTADEVLTAGDDWVWSYTTADDVADWADLIVTVTSRDGSLLASSKDDGEIDLGETDFDAGRVMWAVPTDVTVDIAGTVVVTAKVSIGGVDTTVFEQTYMVRRNRAERAGGGS